MATGDTQDIVNRLVAVLPPWFPTPIANAPILRGLLTGIATPLSWLYSVIAYARTQTRLKTMSGGFLDLASLDFLGPTFSRRVAEPDSSFQARLLAFLLLPKNTVAGITEMLVALTGYVPALLEPAIGTGGYDQTPAFAWDNAGCWSGDALAITAFRPPGQGVPNIDGFDGGFGAFDIGSIEWVDISQTTGAVTDAEIAMRVRQWVAAGVNYTLVITNPTIAMPTAVLVTEGGLILISEDGFIITP